MSPLRFGSSRYDVIVVGARVAGAATAMLLARQGLSVLAIDQQPFGSDTRSTHALMRGGVHLLQRWGILDDLIAAGTPAVRRVTFHYEEEATAVDIRPGGGIDALYAPRRTLLDATIVAHARRAGAEVRHGVRFRDVVRVGERVAGVVVEDESGETVQLAADLVVGADGVASPVARKVEARKELSAGNAGAVLYGYWPGLDPDGIHWHYAPRGAVGVIPTNDGLTCIFAAATPDRFRKAFHQGAIETMLAWTREVAPALADRIAEISPVDPPVGFTGMPGYFRQASGPGWALVGDAGYFKDPITAHGITDALRDADLLSRAVSVGTAEAMADYQRTRDDLSRELFWISDEIASFEWDLGRAKELHLALSQAMKREVKFLESQPATRRREGASHRAA